MTVRVVTQVVAVPGCLGWPAAEAGACDESELDTVGTFSVCLERSNDGYFPLPVWPDASLHLNR